MLEKAIMITKAAYRTINSEEVKLASAILRAKRRVIMANAKKQLKAASEQYKSILMAKMKEEMIKEMKQRGYEFSQEHLQEA